MAIRISKTLGSQIREAQQTVEQARTAMAFPNANKSKWLIKSMKANFTALSQLLEEMSSMEDDEAGGIIIAYTKEFTAINQLVEKLNKCIGGK